MAAIVGGGFSIGVVVLGRVLATPDRRQAAVDRFYEGQAMALATCREELAAEAEQRREAEARESEWREKYYAELAARRGG